MSSIGKAYAESPLHQINLGEEIELALIAGEISKITEDNKPFREYVDPELLTPNLDCIVNMPIFYKPDTKQIRSISPKRMRLYRTFKHNIPFSKLDNDSKKLMLRGLISEIRSYPSAEEFYILNVEEIRDNYLVSDYVTNKIIYNFNGYTR